MKLDRTTRLAALAALVSLAGAAACEPQSEAPAPSTPRISVAQETVPQPPSPEPAPAEPAPPGSPAPPAAPAPAGDEAQDGRYASGEFALGADSSDAYDDDDPSTLTDFRAPLEPYGAWADDPTYGTVWTPSPDAVGADFSPYVTAGHWAYDSEWVWVSDYEWGWAPFHYGRWVWIAGRGWAWIPGRVYRGAWVEWGADDGYTYVGWAPLPPAFVWFGGAAVVLPTYVGPRWVYCARGDVFGPGLRGHVLAGPGAAPVAMHVRPFVSATPGVVPAGPAPQRLGFQAAQIPHAAGANIASVVRAQQFARPATAQALGAHPPTHVPGAVRAAGAGVQGAPPRAVSAGAPGGRPPYAGGNGAGGAPHAPGAAPRPVRSAPVYRGAYGNHRR